jgi:hypothetical protein
MVRRAVIVTGFVLEKSRAADFAVSAVRIARKDRLATDREQST